MREFVRYMTITAIAGAVALTVLGAQGKGKPKPGPTPGTATFDCTTDPGDASRGLCAATTLVAALTTGSTNEMAINDAAGDASAAMQLIFNGQRPEDSPDRTDCSSTGSPACLWNWSNDPRAGDFVHFSLGTNVLDQAGTTELTNGLLGMAMGTTYKVRLNMTIRVPETEHISHWRFNFNPNIPTTGGADLADAVRTGSCSWEFSALAGQRAALSILLKSGKNGVHHEGTFEMPFRLSFSAPNCGA